LLRNAGEAQPVDGVLAAEAGCQVGKYIMNYISRIEGLWSMKPLRPIEEPEQKYYEYEALTNRIVMRSTGAAAVMEFGMGSEMGLVAPDGVRSLETTKKRKKLDDSTASASSKRIASSGPSKPFTRRRGK